MNISGTAGTVNLMRSRVTVQVRRTLKPHQTFWLNSRLPATLIASGKKRLEGFFCCARYQYCVPQITPPNRLDFSSDTVMAGCSKYSPKNQRLSRLPAESPPTHFAARTTLGVPLAKLRRIGCGTPDAARPGQVIGAMASSSS